MCECGLPGPVCDRCKFLDGGRPIDQAIIGALRIATPLSASDIAPMTGKRRENISRALTRLRKGGRVRLVQSAFEKERKTSFFYYELVS